MSCIYRLLILSFFVSCNTHAESPAKDLTQQIREGLLSSFAFDLEEKRSRDFENEWREALDEFSANIAYHYPLTRSDDASAGQGAQGNRTANGHHATATLTWKPMTHWFASTTFYHYLDGGSQQPWSPDFSYSFGYSDWHPYTLSLVYANYGGNRLSPDSDEKFTNFNQGTWSLGWNFVLGDTVQDFLRVHDSSSLDCGLGAHLTPKFSNLLKPDGLDSNKISLSLSCKYTIYEWIYINATAYYYIDEKQKQPWDPDFTYGFGYFDWHPGTISVQYNNYAGNRFPWNEDDGGGGFDKGTISIVYSFKW